jgi:ferredoxin-type protein NapH
LRLAARLLRSDASPSKRRWAQIAAAFALNPVLPNFFTGSIVRGGFKGTCIPVLNCYSCPAAVGACPIGALQHTFAALRFRLAPGSPGFGLYALGTLGLAGSLAGRFPCGWFCPFGLVQELLYKIPGPKIRIPRFLTHLRWAVLALTVFLLPLLVVDVAGYGDVWFCKWICPAGTLEAGIPLVGANAAIRTQIGWLFAWKVALLVLFVLLMIVSMRPFCRTVCPLGAILGLFNKVSWLRLSVDASRCTSCADCAKACPVDLTVHREPNSTQCIRCLKCVKACRMGALTYEIPPFKRLPRAEPVTNGAEVSENK